MLYGYYVTTYHYRFVNSVISSNVEQKVIWSHILSTRYKYLINYISPKCSSDGFIYLEDILNNFEKISLIDGNKGSENMNYNISKSEVNEAAKMFYTLNSCPSLFEKLYLKAMDGPASAISLLASNILKKAKGDSKVKALKIFVKITSVLGFQYISYHHGENKSNIKLTKTILDVKGKMRESHLTNLYLLIQIKYFCKE